MAFNTRIWPRKNYQSREKAIAIWNSYFFSFDITFLVLLSQKHYQYFLEHLLKKSHLTVSCSRWQLYSCKFSNQKSPRWVYVNFNWLSRFKEIAYTERNNGLGWCKLNISKRLKKRWHSIWKYGSPARNRTPWSCLCNPVLKYVWFPLHMLLRIFLTISFVNWEPHKCNFQTEIEHSDRISSELITWNLTWKDSLWNVKFGWVVQDSIFLPVICPGSASKCVSQFLSLQDTEKGQRRELYRNNGWLKALYLLSHRKLGGFVVFTNEMVLENKCVSRTAPPAL